jgi:hypothetical protein
MLLVSPVHTFIKQQKFAVIKTVKHETTFVRFKFEVGGKNS